jgi:hypothetical protein
MALNLTSIKEIGPLVHHYTWRDVIIYALGVGAGSNAASQGLFIPETPLRR